MTVRSSLAGTAFVLLVAVVVVAALFAYRAYRSPSDAAARPSASATSQGIPVSSASPTTVVKSASPSATPARQASPDASHGVITYLNIRTESDPKDLQQPPYFARTTFNTFTVAVSPEGKRVAMLASGETGTQLIWFTTARPNDVTRVLDFSGSPGEVAGQIVWAGDGSTSVLFVANKLTNPASPQSGATYSALRVADLNTKQVREIARITNGSRLIPLSWRPDRQLAGATEIVAGAAFTYDLVHAATSAIDRTDIGGSGGAITASRDGQRIAAIVTAAPEIPPVVRWWPMESPSSAKTITSPTTGTPQLAAFRPGAPDELGVDVQGPCTKCQGGQGVPPPGHFEIWNVMTGEQRVVHATIGFQLWRVDGSAALMQNTLIDPASGATAQLPGTFKLADVVMF